MELKKKCKSITVERIIQWIIVQRYLSATAVAILIIGINYFFFISEAKEKYQFLKTQEVKLKEEFEEKQGKVATLDIYYKQKEKLDTILNKILKLFPDKKNASILSEKIFNLAKSNGLMVNFFAPMHEIRKEFYVELPLRLVISGHYRQLAVFLSKVAQLPYLITFGDFKITKIRGDKFQKLSGQLLMKITLHLYRLSIK
ncbi:type IV pilus inner membrane component PilO [Legionella clemsonensis]|uniref:Pilus assembly protein, PilO n=1 Tax=Legionella clemsonensis TaxID=1867846 RepID=A0A222P110_9GAMM|nr:type 4a pilus biogenesis protein PilO [Legionella clemsonensis]ASQ45465.1 Pilus assembly protein, PilO [Legionella clemsonensis]